MNYQTRTQVSFLGTVAMLNVATGLMFFMITQPEPVTAVASYVPEQKAPLATQVTVPATVGSPSRVVVPSLSIDLSVGLGVFDENTGEWTTSLKKAYYAKNSMPANDSNGVTLIYGHAQSPIFGSLSQLQKNATAKVYTSNGYVFSYVYQSKEDVTPDNTTLFRSSGAPTLILQTCTGDWDAYRALYSFALVSVRKV